MTIQNRPTTPARERALAAVSVLSTQNTELERIFEQIYNQLPSLQLGSIATGVSGVELIRCVNSLVPRLWFGFETSMCAIGCHHVEICAFLIMPFVLMTYLPFSSLLTFPLLSLFFSLLLSLFLPHCRHWVVIAYLAFVAVFLLLFLLSICCGACFSSAIFVVV